MRVSNNRWVINISQFLEVNFLYATIMKAFNQNALFNVAVLGRRKAALLFNSKVFIFTIQQETKFVNSDVLNRPKRFQHCSPKQQRAF